MAHKLSSKVEAQIEKMIKGGKTNFDICEALNVSEAPIRRIRHALKDTLPPKRNKELEIESMLKMGATNSEIIGALHCGDHIITRVRKRIADELPIDTQPIPSSPTDKMRMLAEKKEIGAMFRKKTFYEIIGQDITAAIQALPAPKPINAKLLKLNQKQEPEELIIKFSDSQIGSIVNEDETGGLGAYSTDIFLERLEYFKKSLEKIFEIHLTSTPCPRLHIFFLGDIVDGRLIFKGQTIQTDRSVIGQCIIAIEKIAELVLWAASIYPWQVTCSCVIGNHGRIGNKGELSVMDNFDYLIYRMLERFLCNVPNVTLNVPNSPRMIIEIMGRRHLLTHGDNMKSWGGIPFYGFDRAKARFSELFQDAGEQFDYIHIGHFHQTAALRGKQFMNGCWPGGSQFSIDVMQVGSIPTQQFHAVHPVHGIVLTREIQLCDPRTLKGKVKIW